MSTYSTESMAKAVLLINGNPKLEDRVKSKHTHEAYNTKKKFNKQTVGAR